jgi:hypothetical protein
VEEGKYDTKNCGGGKVRHKELWRRESTTQIIAKRKSTKDKQFYKTLYKRVKIQQHKPHKTGNELRYSGRVGTSCSTNDNRRFDFVKIRWQVTNEKTTAL